MSIREELAETVGTFTLVFIGAGAGALAVAGNSGGGLVGVALAHALALVVIVFAWGSISGAHVNPAVTFGLALAGRFSWLRAARYWVAQLLGAALAGYLLLFLIGPQGNLGMTLPAPSVSVVQAIVIEAVLTFFLVTAVFGSAVAGRNGNAAALAIGLVLGMDILMGGPLTGGSMNPARSFGPALAMGDFTGLYIYFVGPLLGGGLAALFYDRVYLRGR
ncbi:MAG: putative aquaporin TIP2-2 [Anaerolineales bacterium]|nr:putative aquaporin TIP2-2 [Anaerolineales bacterium]